MATTVFLGTFTGGPGGGMEMDGPPSESEGIYRATFCDGAFSDLTLVAEVQCSPSWFRWHPTLPVLYTTNETFDGSASSVTAFRLTPSGGLERMGRVSTGGGSACHLSVHPKGHYIGVTNHGQDFGGTAFGSTALLSVDPATGELLEQTDFVAHEEPTDPELLANPAREDWTPHAHSAHWSPCGHFLFVCEKGTDRIIVYKLDEATGKLTSHSETMVSIGGGARHLAVHPDNIHIYVNEEAGAKVTVYDWDASAGILTPTQTLTTLPENFDKSVFTAELALGPGAKTLHVANRVWPPLPDGGDKGFLSTYAVNADASLSFLAHTELGRHPRHFKFSPCGRWMVCGAMHEHRVDVFEMDEKGVPQPTGKSLAMPTPTHSLWLAPETLALAQEMAGLTTTTTTTVTHPDGTTVNVKTTAASAAKI